MHPDLNAIAAFIDNRLDQEERAAVVQHLAACVECRQTLAAFSRGQAAPAITPAGASVARQLRGHWIWLPVAASLAVATTVGLLVLRNEQGVDLLIPAPHRPQIDKPLAPPASPTVPPKSETVGETPKTPPERPRQSTDDLTTRRSGVRRLGDKTFSLVAGEWVDSAYDPLGLLPVENVLPDAREALLDRLPGLKPYAALGPRVVVVYRGVVYRFSPS